MRNVRSRHIVLTGYWGASRPPGCAWQAAGCRLGLLTALMTLSLVGMPLQCFSQTSERKGFEIQSFEKQGKNVSIRYRIPYGGYVEVVARTPQGRQIGYTAFVHKPGQHETTFYPKRRIDGHTVIFEFRYKGNHYKREYTF